MILALILGTVAIVASLTALGVLAAQSRYSQQIRWTDSDNEALWALIDAEAE